MINHYIIVPQFCPWDEATINCLIWKEKNVTVLFTIVNINQHLSLLRPQVQHSTTINHMEVSINGDTPQQVDGTFFMGNPIMAQTRSWGWVKTSQVPHMLVDHSYIQTTFNHFNHFNHINHINHIFPPLPFPSLLNLSDG